VIANLDGMAAADLAAQAAPLAVLGLVDAPISGALSGGLLSDGTVGPMSGHLSIAAGTLRAGGMATPVAFDAADLALSYDPRGQRVTLSGLSVESPVLKVSARGTVDLLDGSGAPARPGALPAALVAQFAVSEAMADFEGVFETPVRFTGGAAGLRIRLDPFRVEIGEIRLSDGEDYMALSGEVGVARDGGWQAALDVALNRIDAQRLITIWPVSVVPNTRRWLAENLDEGTFTDVTASFRGAQGRVPRFALDYDFRGAEVRVIRTLPPVKKGYGRAAIQDNSYTVVIEGGHVTRAAGRRYRRVGHGVPRARHPHQSGAGRGGTAYRCDADRHAVAAGSGTVPLSQQGRPDHRSGRGPGAAGGGTGLPAGAEAGGAGCGLFRHRHPSTTSALTGWWPGAASPRRISRSRSRRRAWRSRAMAGSAACPSRPDGRRISVPRQRAGRRSRARRRSAPTGWRIWA
jgi:hypothetical protein